MAEPLAWWNGQLKPFSQIAVPVTDAGFMLGVTVAEQLRTFRGKLFRLDEHLARLGRSLEIVEVTPGFSLPELSSAAIDLAARNFALLAPGDDLNLTMFVTPGAYGSYAGADPHPIVCIHTQPLPFRNWARLYEEGQSLVVTDIRQTPSECWPTELKCRSRMHYFLADRRAARIEKGARALMLDLEGLVTEASTANVVAYFAGEGLVSPPKESILPGISVAVLEELAASDGIPFTYRPLTLAEVARANEFFLTSTSPCLLPVVQVDGAPIGNGAPGKVFRQLIEAWGRRVGVDLIAQAKEFADG